MPGRPVIAAAETLPAPLPGWYGKLPGLGDFAARRLDKAMVGVWDGWLQDGLQALRQQSGWLDAYLQSPVWCFALGAGVLGPQRWLGVMRPTVDAVGRDFPLYRHILGDTSLWKGCLTRREMTAIVARLPARAATSTPDGALSTWVLISSPTSTT